MKGIFDVLRTISIILLGAKLVDSLVQDPHQVVVIMYGPSGNRDLDLLSKQQLKLPYSSNLFTIAAPNFKSSYYGFISGQSQGAENISYNFTTNTIYNDFKNAGYTTAAIGKSSELPKVDSFNSTIDPLIIFEAAAKYIAANARDKFFLTVQFDRVDINFIPGVPLDNSIACREKLPPWQKVCIEKTYASSIRWAADQTNYLLSKLGNNSTVVWFPAVPPDDPSVHEFSAPRRDNLGLKDSLLGLEMPLKTNFPIYYPGRINAIDLRVTLNNIAGIIRSKLPGIDLRNSTDVRTKELWWFTPVATKGKCIFNSGAYARITNINGVEMFQTWDAERNLCYLASDKIKLQPSRACVAKPVETKIAIPACVTYPVKSLQTIRPRPTKPRIISVLVLDDMNLLNHLLSLAPELQDLFDSGVVFNNFHAWIICSPSRSMLLTSLSAMNSRIGMFSVFPDAYGARPGKGMPAYLGARGPVTTMPEFFSNNGRISILSGKEHVDGYVITAEKLGFTPGYVKCYDCKTRSGSIFNQFTDLFPEQSSELIFNHSMEKTDQALALGKDVFAYLGFKTMHIKIFISKLGLAASNSTLATSDIKGAPRFDFPAPTRTQLGLARLFARGLLNYMQYLQRVAPDNHMVVLTCDNGPENYGIDGSTTVTGPYIDRKRGLGEGGHRVDAWIGGLGVRGVVPELTSIMDILPTVIAASGDTQWTPPDKGKFEGKNLLPLIVSGDNTGFIGRGLSFERRGPQHGDFLKVPGRFAQALYDEEGDWRLVLGSTEMKPPALINHFKFISLYNVRTDPSESNNIADLRPDKVAKLTEMLRSYKPYSSNSYPTSIPPDAGSQKCKSYIIGAPC